MPPGSPEPRPAWDASVPERFQDSARRHPGALAIRAGGQELTYAARVSLDDTRMQIEGKWVDLAPGMAVTVEIKTGQRRIAEYLLSPLLRVKQESLRER